MNYDVAAIPTVYKGVQFRSRLEARWAAFFDEVGWRWTYEPIDLPGWIPDFLIHGKHESLYSEVKPLDTFDEGIANRMEKAASKAGLTSDLLLLGIAPFPGAYWGGSHSIGWLGEYHEWTAQKPPPQLVDLREGSSIPQTTLHGWAFDQSVLVDCNDDRVGLAHGIHSYRDRIHGVGGHKNWNILDAGRVEAGWASACNRVQWRPPR